MSTKKPTKKTFKLTLLDGETVELLEVARIGDFVAHPPWQMPRSRSCLVITHAPDGCVAVESYAKVVRAFIEGAKTGRTLARYTSDAWRRKCSGEEITADSVGGIAWRAVKRYQRILEARIEL